MSAELRPLDLFRRIYGTVAPYEQLIPSTPYGVAAFLPVGGTEGGITWPTAYSLGRTVIDTDSLSVKKSDGSMTSSDQEASDVLAKAFVASREPDPTGKMKRWWADGVFLGGAGKYSFQTDNYGIALVDSEERFPREKTVTLHVPLKSWTVTDAITGKDPTDPTKAPSSSIASTLQVRVPAAGYRLLHFVAH